MTSALAKMWLTFKRLPSPSSDPSDEKKDFAPTIDYFTAAIEKEYDCLNARLSEFGQRFIALPDRPSIADFATLPFANAQVATMAGIQFSKWTRLVEWSNEMMELSPMKAAMSRVTEF
jgi:glutathione S-transferase